MAARFNKKLYSKRPQILSEFFDMEISAVALAQKYGVNKDTMYKVLGEWGAVGKREEVTKKLPFNIINTAHTKGGVTKSTIAWNLAIALQEKGLKVSLLDLDAQKSCTSLSMIRARTVCSPLVVMLVKDLRELELLIESVSEDEVLIIDEGGFDSDLNRVAMFKSDVIITPLQDSIMDILGLKRFEDVLDDVGNPKTKILLNMVHPNTTDFSPFENAIKENLHLEILKPKFVRSNWFDIAHRMGKGVSELNTRNKQEKPSLERVQKDMNALCFELLGV